MREFLSLITSLVGWVLIIVKVLDCWVLCVISIFLFNFLFMGSEGEQVLNGEKKYGELKREELLYNCSIIQNSALVSDMAAALLTHKE